MNLKTNERGATILVVVSVIAVLAVLTAAALDYTATVGENVRRTLTMQAAQSIANGCLQHEFMYWREINRESSTVQGLPTSSFASMPLPSSSQFPNISGFSATASVDPTGGHTVSNCNIVAVTPQFTALTGTATVPGYGPISQNTSCQSLTYNYLASADVYLAQRGMPVTFKARQIFQKQYISPWNWAIFYVDPLEIHPGAPFEVNGWVQTNSDLYTAHNYLTFDDKVNYGNNWYIGFMSGDGSHNGETPVSPNFPANLPPTQAAQQQPFGMDSSRIFSTTDSNDNDDSYHELVEYPDSSQTDPIANQRYFNQASVKVAVDANNNVYILNSANTVLTSHSSGNDGQLYTTFTSAITTGVSIQDNRQAASVRLVSLDVSKIAAAVKNNALNAFNGVVYVIDYSADNYGGTPQRGVRLLNGSVAPTGGLTVVSPNPVYIQGDYNTGANPPSNSGTPTQPTASSYVRQPCAVVADAVNVLSNNWSDSRSTSSVSSRPATNTTVNTAIIAGIVPSANGNYSGGAENFPRFLEDWSGKTFTYYGSMVELFASHQATGVWGAANVYSPPSRNWYFDTNFATNPPPGSLMVVNYSRAQWWQQ